MLTMGDINPAAGSYVLTEALFIQGYNLLVGDGLEGKKVLEICCGRGDMSTWLASSFRGANVTGIDISDSFISEALPKKKGLSNLNFMCMDCMQLSDFPDETFDVVVGQAAMHHLTHNLPLASKELSRVLKKGGMLLFIFEPLGHNPIVSAIRSVRNTLQQHLDESMLFEDTIRKFSSNFSRYKIYHFGLIAYFCKALPKRSKIAVKIYNICNFVDQNLFMLIPGLSKYAANFNVAFWK
jgi:ubiquinone/menaquinone biosynthesis C-methylase UbiE